MEIVWLSSDKGSYVYVTDLIPKRLSKVDLVNQVTISGHDARLRCYGAEEDDKIVWKRIYDVMIQYDILGKWRPNRDSKTFEDRYFFAGNWSDTLYIKGAVITDAGIYSCETEDDPESYGHLTILSMH